ncbi:hypothetical protein ES707_06979 [subsurface metagenome]
METVRLGNRSPWVTIWTMPRATIRKILDTNPKHMVLLLAMLGGFAYALSRFSGGDIDIVFPVPIVLLICTIVGSIGGVISLYIGGALLSWTGRWIGGQASPTYVRAAIAWSYIPLIWALIIYIPEFVLLMKRLSINRTVDINTNPLLFFTLFGFIALKFIVGIWAFIIFLKCLGEAQRFSAWKALGNLFLGGVVPMVPVMIVKSFISL